MLILSREQFSAIVAHARAGLPHEACGLIAGRIRDGEGGTERLVSKVYTLTNTDRSAEHFSMAPAEQFQAISDIRKNQAALLGNFHSHPNTPARPSDEDIRHAYDKELVYVIISLMEDEPQLKGFIINNNGSVEEELIRIE
jgi:proteasome lid subunit RPN8/RPN11